MARRLKLLTGLSTLALSGALALGGCGGEGEGEGAEGEAATAEAHGAHSAEAAGGAAEGEGAKAPAGGESEGAARGGNPTTDDVAYLTQLLRVRGHLMAFHELYGAASYENASVHVKHPESELYAALVPAFKARGNAVFADALSALAAANETGGDVEGAYDAVKAAITAVEPKTSLKNRVLAASKVARIAADEFDVAAEDDGKISNVKEYQDAYGFLSVSKEMLLAASAGNGDERAALYAAIEQLDAVIREFDGWSPQTTTLKPSAIYGAAARIEIAGLGLS